jgi:hypothetical protein
MALEQGKFFPPFHTKSGKGIEMGTRTDMGGTDSLAEHAYRIVAVEREAAFVCRFIDTTNAGEYAADQYDRGLRSWRDMPPIVPPWINFWMEAPVDLQTMDDTFTTVIRKTSSRYAVLWSALTRAILGEAWNEPPDVVVCLEGMLFLEIDGKACGPIGVWKIGLDDRGIAVNEEFKSMFAHLDEQDGTPVNERQVGRSPSCLAPTSTSSPSPVARPRSRRSTSGDTDASRPGSAPCGSPRSAAVGRARAAVRSSSTSSEATWCTMATAAPASTPPRAFCSARSPGASSCPCTLEATPSTVRSPVGP